MVKSDIVNDARTKEGNIAEYINIEKRVLIALKKLQLYFFFFA